MAQISTKTAENTILEISDEIKKNPQDSDMIVVNEWKYTPVKTSHPVIKKIPYNDIYTRIHDLPSLVKELKKSFIHKYVELLPGMALAGGSIMDTIYCHKPKDYDIFFYGISIDEMKEKITKICRDLLQNYGSNIKFYRSQSVLTVVDSGNNNIIQFILINNVNKASIIYNFDVGPSQFLIDHNYTLYTTLQGYYSLSHSANIVDLKSRKTTFEFRLHKYYAKGFNIILPLEAKERLAAINPNKEIKIQQIVFHQSTNYTDYSNKKIVKNDNEYYCQWSYICTNYQSESIGESYDGGIDYTYPHSIIIHNIKCIIAEKLSGCVAEVYIDNIFDDEIPISLHYDNIGELYNNGTIPFIIWRKMTNENESAMTKTEFYDVEFVNTYIEKCKACEYKIKMVTDAAIAFKSNVISTEEWCSKIKEKPSIKYVKNTENTILNQVKRNISRNIGSDKKLAYINLTNMSKNNPKIMKMVKYLTSPDVDRIIEIPHTNICTIYSKIKAILDMQEYGMLNLTI